MNCQNVSISLEDRNAMSGHQKWKIYYGKLHCNLYIFDGNAQPAIAFNSLIDTIDNSFEILF